MKGGGEMYDNNLRNFCLFMYVDPSMVIDKMDIGDFEYVFTLTNGRRYRYEAAGCKVYPLSPNIGADGNLTELEWRKEFARRLKKQLRYKHISQQELAKMINVSSVSVSKYMTGKATANGYVISKIAKAVDYPIERLTNFDYLL